MARLDTLLADAARVYDQAKAVATEDGRELAGTVVLFSGGNDSTTIAHMFGPPNLNVADYAGHCNTGIGIEQTRQYVRDTCARWDLPLLEKHPPGDRTYRRLVLGDTITSKGPRKGAARLWEGFPGPAGHQVMFNALKQRGLNQMRRDLVKDHRRQRAVIISGVRQTESTRRQHRPAVSRVGSVVYANPLLGWTKLDMNAYRRSFPDVPRNEVADLLHMSGECLCGAFAHPGELDEIACWYPEVAQEIRDLEKEAAARSIPRCRWGQGKGTPCDGICNL